MAIYQRNVQVSISCSVHETECLSCSSVHVGILMKQALVPFEGMNLPVGARTSRQSKGILLPLPLEKFRPEGMIQT